MSDPNQNDPKRQKPQHPNQPQKRDESQQPVRRPDQQHDDKDKPGKMPDEDIADEDEVTGRQPRPDVP